MKTYKSTNADKVINKFDTDLVERARKNLDVHIDTGKLYSGMKMTYDEVGHGYNLSINWEHYGEFVDQGRKPGKGIPVDVLKGWIERNGLHLNMKSNLSDMAKINSLSFLINRKIKREGIKPTYFLTDAIDELLPKFADDVAYAIGEDILDSFMD